jgi:hypothetical protein
MKTVTLTLVLSLLSAYVFAQTPVKMGEVPKAVLKSYYSHNSKGAKDSVWSKQILTIYEVTYVEDGTKYQASYFENGDWIKTINEIPMANVPPMVINQLAQLYPGYTATKAFNELNNDGKFYALEIMRDKDKMLIYFTPSGKFFK